MIHRLQGAGGGPSVVPGGVEPELLQVLRQLAEDVPGLAFPARRAAEQVLQTMLDKRQQTYVSPVCIAWLYSSARSNLPSFQHSHAMQTGET